jgi:hypothetical protein
MKALVLVLMIALIPPQALAQTPGSPSTRSPQPQSAAVDDVLATPTGHEVNVSVGGYRYTEPGAQSISIHGAKIGGGYTGTFALDERRHWFTQADVRAIVGNATYDGWCSPFLIAPSSASPNGYKLGLGDASPCSESGDKDGYVEARALVGTDFIGRTWGWSPDIGLGVRRLSNGTTGVAGYRTDTYLYLPLGLTARTRGASHGALSVNVEYDRLLRGWQTTRDSRLGGGDVPATTTAPAFTIDGFSDVSFAQHGGWALRAGAKYPLARHWSVEPSYIRWRISDSPISDEIATFTVNRVTAQQPLGAYEPLNATNEFVVKLGFHF